MTHKNGFCLDRFFIKFKLLGWIITYKALEVFPINVFTAYICTKFCRILHPQQELYMKYM